MLPQPLDCGRPYRAIRTGDLMRALIDVFHTPGQDYGHVNPSLKRIGIFVALEAAQQIEVRSNFPYHAP